MLSRFLAITALVLGTAMATSVAASPDGLPSTHTIVSGEALGTGPTPGGCNTEVSLSLTRQSLSGWIGGEPVSMVRRGNQLFGAYRQQPIFLHISGLPESGYRLIGTIAGEKVEWKIDAGKVLTSVPRCIGF